MHKLIQAAFKKLICTKVETRFFIILLMLGSGGGGAIPINHLDLLVQASYSQ